MMLAPDPLTHKRLVLVRQLYERAIRLAGNERSAVDCLLAVVTFDLASETAMKAVVSALDPGKTLSRTFDGVLQQVGDSMSSANLGGVPDRGHLLQVHNIRNDAQHRGASPSASEVSDCRTYTRDFLRALIRQVWDIEFEQVSLAALVATLQIQAYLQEAEQALHAEDWERAAEQAALAIETAISLSKDRIGDNWYFQSLASPFDLDKQYTAPDTIRAIEELQHIMRLQLVGMDLGVYLDYKRTCGTVRFYYPRRHKFNPPEGGVTQAVAEYAVAYVTESVLGMEQRLGDLKPPPPSHSPPFPLPR